MATGKGWFVAATAALVLLAGAGTALFIAQRNARSGLIERFEQRPAGAVAFLGSALTSSQADSVQYARRLLGKERLSRADLRRYAQGGQNRPGDLLLVLSQRGAVLASARPVSDARLRRLLGGRYLRAGLAGEFFASGPRRGASGVWVLRLVTPYRAAGRRSVLVEEVPATVADFIAGALPSIPAGIGGEAYVVGAGGRVLSATDVTRTGTPPARRALTRAIATSDAGTYEDRGGDQRFVVRNVPRSDWRLVLSAPEARVLAAVRGANRWIPWALFLGFVATILATFAFWRRAERSARALADREARYRALVENVPGIVYIAELGKATRWLYASRPIATILGYTAEEWVAGEDLWTERLLPADRAAAVAAREHAWSSGEPLRSEYRMVARDGRVVWFRDEAAVLEEDESRVLQGVMYDVTELKAEEESIRSSNRQLEGAVEEQTRELQASRTEVLERLALAAEYRDDATLQHTERVGRTAALIAERMGLDDESVSSIRLAAPLHDVGKLSTPDTILLKRGALHAQEYERIKAHAAVGGKILAGSRSYALQLAEEIARAHHERWDGSGYPAGLAGEQIPLAARIVAVADVFDALTHSRPYKDAWPIAEAVAEIRRQAGVQFDPHVVEAFAQLDHDLLATSVMRDPGNGAARTPAADL